MANIERRLQRLEQRRQAAGTVRVIDGRGLSPEQQAAKVAELGKSLGDGPPIVVIDR